MNTQRHRLIVTWSAACAIVLALIGGAVLAPHLVHAAPSGTTVQDWQTSQAGDRLTAKANLTFGADDGSSLPTIQITPTRYYQAMDGFGGTFNEAGWSLLSQLSSSAQSALLTELFDPTNGAGFTLTRTPMGLDDFSLSQYTYDDLSSGTDFAMSQFSVNHDLQYLIPYIKAAESHGSFRIVASPWSAPAWMKTNDSLTNGGSVIDPSTDARYYQAYALYFQKYVQAYAQNGIPINFIVPQNEPGYPAAFGSTIWTSAQEANFVANYLGPQFQNNNVPARLRIFEWNRDQWTFPKAVLDDTSTAPYVAGVDWHDYDCLNSGGCQPDDVDLFNDAHPGYSNWMSEYTAINTAPHTNYSDGETWGNTIMNDVRHGDGGWIYWNMILNQNGGPYASTSGPQDPLVEIDTSTNPPTVTYLPKFWYLAQFSKFVRPGAYRIGADGGVANDGLQSLAFKNSDGSEVLVVMNTSGAAQQIKVREDGNIFKPTLDAHSINTFKWSAPVNTYHIIAGGTNGWNSIASDPYTADAHYSGGGTATNIHTIANTADTPLYEPERNGNFSYNFPVPNGRYQVTLKFSENYWNCSGCRLFNVSAEGSTVLSNFDIYAAAGGEYKAYDKTFEVNVGSGSLDLQFTTVKDNAKVDAIAVTPLPVTGDAFKSTLSVGVPSGYSLSAGIAPGYVFAQDYNLGGEGYAYHFANHNGTDTSYRADATNLETCSNDAHCGDDLGWLSNGDYANYTINVLVGGNYDIQAQVADPATNGQFAVQMDGAPLSGTQTVPDTGSYQTWQAVPIYGLNLSQGIHTFTFQVMTGGFNLHYLFFKKVQRLDTLPDQIQAEWYAGGGEGTGYHDTTAGDASTLPYPGFYRPEDVDLEISSTGNYDVGHIDTGEWLRYDLYNPNSTSTSYTLTFSVASASGGGQIRVDLDSIGNTIGAAQSVPNTGGWQTWQNLAETVMLPAGTHAIYLYFPAGGFNLDDFQVS